MLAWSFGVFFLAVRVTFILRRTNRLEVSKNCNSMWSSFGILKFLFSELLARKGTDRKNTMAA